MSGVIFFFDLGGGFLIQLVLNWLSIHGMCAVNGQAIVQAYLAILIRDFGTQATSAAGGLV
jgi:hypothetical protein